MGEQIAEPLHSMPLVASLHQNKRPLRCFTALAEMGKPKTNPLRPSLLNFIWFSPERVE
jgi:hypothetical protein